MAKNKCPHCSGGEKINPFEYAFSGKHDLMYNAHECEKCGEVYFTRGEKEDEN